MKAAAELSKEVIEHYKPGGKFGFISNSHCMECRKVPSVNKCKVCVAEKWKHLSTNKYMIPVIEDFIRSEEFKELYKDIEKCESNYNSEYENCKYSNKIALMASLSRNSTLTPFLANKIIDFYWFVADKVKETVLMKFALVPLIYSQRFLYQRYPLILFKDFSVTENKESKFSINKTV